MIVHACQRIMYQSRPVLQQRPQEQRRDPIIFYDHYNTSCGISVSLRLRDRRCSQVAAPWLKHRPNLALIADFRLVNLCRVAGTACDRVFAAVCRTCSLQ